MELTVVLAGIPVRLSLRSPAYAACFQPFWTEADPVAAVRVPEDALKEAAPHYEAGRISGARSSCLRCPAPLRPHTVPRCCHSLARARMGFYRKQRDW